MSESTDVAKDVAPSHRNIIVIIITFLLLILGYVAGYFFGPSMIRSAYQRGDCQSVLSSDDFYARMFPFSQLEQSTSTLVRECAVYTLGVTSKAERKWSAAYDAFSVYFESYPDGKFASDAYDHSAVALMAMVLKDVEQGNYVKANIGLNYILENYADTPEAAEAETLIPDIRMKLGMELRNTEDFAAAEQIFKELGDYRMIQLELAQTYLSWGLALQAQEKFAEAESKFNLAKSTDPDPSSASGPAMQAKVYQAGLYMQWGNSLVKEGDFTNAIARYEMAESLGEDQDKVDEMIAKGYVQWAIALDPGEDLFGALTLLDFAQASSAADSVKILVDDARSEVYLAFSKSSGEMAQKAIADAVRSVCELRTEPSLPVFGMDDESIGFGVDGVDVALPDDLAAISPASLHYVACVDEDTKVAGVKNGQPVRLSSTGSAKWYYITFVSFQYFWDVVLMDIETGWEVGEVSIDGDLPEALPTGDPYSVFVESPVTQIRFGSKPDISVLAEWLLDVTE